MWTQFLKTNVDKSTSYYHTSKEEDVTEKRLKHSPVTTGVF